MELNAEAVRRDDERIIWQDKELLNNLKYSFDEYSESQIDPDAFFISVDKGIERNWLQDATKLPAMVNFRIVPGRIVPKKDTTDRERLVWNG